MPFNHLSVISKISITGEFILNKMILLFMLLLGAEPLSAQIYICFYPCVQTKSGAIQEFVNKNNTKLLSNQIHNYYFLRGYAKSNVHQNILQEYTNSLYHSFSLNDISTSSDKNSQTSLWVEMGYVLAMETVFTGMSYLASRKKGCGPAIAGGFDLFMGMAGLQNASKQKSGIQTIGHYSISAGFIVKSLYNFQFGKNHSTNTRFWTNFIGFNVLVFIGYYLDTLN